MTYFKLSIPSITTAVNSYKDNKKQVMEDANYIFNEMKNSDVAWNDDNSEVFIKRVKRDKKNFEEYFDYIDNLYDEINCFKTSIDKLCKSYGYDLNTVKLTFDDSNIETIKKYLGNAIYYINDSLERIRIGNFPVDFSDFNTVYYVRNMLYNVKNTITSLYNDIDNFSKSVNMEIANSRQRIAKVSKEKIGIKPAEYSWHTRNIDSNGMNKLDMPQISSISGSQISQKDVEMNNMQRSGHYIAQEQDAQEKKENDTMLEKESLLYANELQTKMAEEKDLSLQGQEYLDAKAEDIQTNTSNDMVMDSISGIETNKNIINMHDNSNLNLSEVKTYSNTGETTINQTTTNLNLTPLDNVEPQKISVNVNTAKID